ncbi:hypothetical protein BDQ17DRAFT_386597 [Cyathus striatus]|nr:hypothetical protein BDQ17DRAFT_386597 [Cyathus striatus]
MEKAPTFAKLNSTNYREWCDNMEAYLKTIGLWRITSGKSTKPSKSSPPTPQEITAENTWEEAADKAAGILFLAVEQEQKIHFSSNREDC